MKQHQTIRKLLASCVLLVTGFDLFAQKEMIATGKKTFETYCGACHSIHYEIAGPALASITKKRSITWLHAFIKNSQNVIASGDKYANHLAEQYGHMVMPSFKLSDEEITNVLLYIKKESVLPCTQLDERQETKNISEGSNKDILHGQDLFRNQCSSCHAVHNENYGPALASVTKRRPTKWLVDFIKNSQRVIKTGDSYSAHIFEKFDKKIMVSMEFLSESEIHDILSYIDFASRYRPIQKSTRASTSRAAKKLLVESTSPNRFFTIFFITLTLVGAVIQGFLIAKLYQHLEKNDELA